MIYIVPSALELILNNSHIDLLTNKRILNLIDQKWVYIFNIINLI